MYLFRNKTKTDRMLYLVSFFLSFKAIGQHLRWCRVITKVHVWPRSKRTLYSVHSSSRASLRPLATRGGVLGACTGRCVHWVQRLIQNCTWRWFRYCMVSHIRAIRLCPQSLKGSTAQSDMVAKSLQCNLLWQTSTKKPFKVLQPCPDLHVICGLGLTGGPC